MYNCCTLRKKNKAIKFFDFFWKCWNTTYPNVIVIGLFGLFVVFLNNGDIVVGDRSAHIPRFHPMQLCYFVMFVITFSLPWLLSQAYCNTKTTKSVFKFSNITTLLNDVQINFSKLILVALLPIISSLVYFNTIAHPYLLADNRHYTFYAWRLLFGSNKPVFLRYLPVPFYAYGLYLMDTKLMRSSIAYKLAYWIVTPLVLCAQFLLEPRYFVVPYLMYRLHSDRNNSNSNTLKAALIEFGTYQSCNFIIMWIFLYRPFVSTMDNTKRLDRFTW